MTNFLTGIGAAAANTVIGNTLSPRSAGAARGVVTTLSSLSNGTFDTKAAANLGASAAISMLNGVPASDAIGGALSGLGLGTLGGLFGVGGFSGQKPQALHTEYAGSEAQGPSPYTEGNDIVFFLLRADQTAPAPASPSGQAAATAATSQTGDDFLGKALQSPLGQLATGVALSYAVPAATSALSSAIGGSAGQNLAGPLTGVAFTAGLTAIGANTQAAATTAGGTTSSVTNATGSGPDAVSTAQATSAASLYSGNSQNYFQNVTASSFSGSTATFSTASSPELSSAFSGGATSALATPMGTAFPSVASNEDFSVAAGDHAAAYSNTSTNPLVSAIAPLNEDALSIASSDTEATIPKSWYFITAPQDVNWTKDSKVATVDTYGTNTPYVMYGSTSLRKLTLGNVMLEGFSDRKTVEANIVALETCMNMVINADKGFTSPYCWKLYSGGKNYGTFIITGVKVKEAMRDLRGYATRAFVDIELQQVPEYQITSGRDLASKASTGKVTPAAEKQLKASSSEQDKAVNGAKTAGSGGSQGAGGGTGSAAAAAAGGSGGGGGQGGSAPRNLSQDYANRYRAERGR